MNKFLALAILSTTVALGAASAEAATYSYGPARQTVIVEGRNAADFFAARNGAAAINQQSELNARQTR
ncbi:MAG: TerC family rane protein [Xanthobacteraceae bacterium]|jgi:hypothetical protein|nr:TerC family rane protein [Xanthobacteraceae bacterium]